MISVKQAHKYCSEDISTIENYDKAINDKIIWHIHHRNEILGDGTQLSSQELKDLGLYYNRPAKELIFLTPSEHRSIHRIGMICSDETKKKMSDAHTGSRHSKKTREKQSKSHTNLKRKYLDIEKKSFVMIRLNPMVSYELF